MERADIHGFNKVFDEGKVFTRVLDDQRMDFIVEKKVGAFGLRHKALNRFEQPDFAFFLLAVVLLLCLECVAAAALFRAFEEGNALCGLSEFRADHAFA